MVVREHWEMATAKEHPTLANVHSCTAGRPSPQVRISRQRRLARQTNVPEAVISVDSASKKVVIECVE